MQKTYKLTVARSHSVGCWLIALCLLLLPLLAACQEKQETVGTNIVGYNHTDKGIVFSVDGQGGAYIQPHKGGGGFACCISVPKPWKPGMKVKVEWRLAGTQTWREQVVLVPEYDDIGNLDVHFLSDGQIKVFVTMYALWHPDYPLKGEEAQLIPGQDPKGPFNR